VLKAADNQLQLIKLRDQKLDIIEKQQKLAAARRRQATKAAASERDLIQRIQRQADYIAWQDDQIRALRDYQSQERRAMRGRSNPQRAGYANGHEFDQPERWPYWHNPRAGKKSP
jgi:hypothetical protein